jgi:hypothetical protein
VEASARNPAPVRGQIFIVGAMGTGTTLLRLMLDSHPNIAIPHETGFMRIYNAMRFVPFKWSGRRWAERLGWSKEEMDEEARRYFDRIFMRYAERHGKQRWGEKTPQHLWHVGNMKQVFPESVFIGVVRHPGAAVASNMRRFGHTTRWSAYHCRRYYRELARQASLHPKRFVVLRYEDLVQQPDRLMRELLDWLGEPWSDNVVEHHRVHAERQHDRTEGLTRADQPIDPSRIDDWADKLTDGERRWAVIRLSGIAEFFGYSFEDLGALAPLNESGSLLFGGKEVRTRIARFEDLELGERGEMPVYERLYHPEKVILTVNPFGRPRFQAGEVDAALPPPDSRAKRAVALAVRKLPDPVGERIRAVGRRLGVGRRRTEPLAPTGGPPE